LFLNNNLEVIMKKFLAAALVMLLAVVINSFAQTTTGRLAGTVSTPDGVLPGATVTATDATTGKEQTATTNESGSFLFPQLEFGTYTVKVTAQGFKTFIANEVKIDVGREYSLNPLLEVGSVSESVTVTAGADVVTSNTAQVSNTVSPQQILSLPLLTRNPLSLTTLQAGTQSNPFQETAINGMRTSFTNITRDGINIQDNFIRQNATDFAPGRPSVDDTAEFTIATANQEADQGYGGAQIRLVTPRGTQEFHGALFAYNRNSKFQANNFFRNRSSNPSLNRAPAFRNRNQFGGKVGGPLPLPGFGEGTPMFYKDKGFFFFAYEKIIDPVSGVQSRTILTPSARAGILTYNRTIAGQPISTPFVNCPSGAAGTVCTANILGLANSLNFNNTPATINPVIQSRILSGLPTQGNFTGLGDQLNTTGFQFSRKANVERTTYTTRIDVDFDQNNSINGVYSWNLEQTLRNDMDPTGFTEIPRGNLASKNKTLALAYRRTFTPTLVNEVRGGIFFSDVQFGTFENPSIVLAVPLISNPENNTLSQGRVVKTYNLQDNVDWVIGRHSLRFGGQLQYFQPTSTDNFGILPTLTIGTSSATPFFTAAQLPGGISTTQLGTANSLLALLGGYISQEAQTFNLVSPTEGFAAGPNIQPFRYSNHSLYLADRWQISNSLTLNMGLRYELFPALKIANGVALEPVIADPDNPAASLLNPNGFSDVVGGNSGKENTFYKTDYNNFAPQIGFAYAPKFKGGFTRFLLGETFVIRGGYSHVYGNDQLVTAVLQAPGNIVGFGSRTGFGTTPTGSTQLNLRLGDSLPAIVTPTLTPPPPYSFIRNNTPGIGGSFVNGTVFGVDPKLKTPMYQQYSFGVQREFWGNTAVEVRYVGTRSDNLLRAFNLNQIDIISNGFLADFNRARANYLASQQFVAGTTTPATPFCGLPGSAPTCTPLQIFRATGVANNAPITGAPGRLLVGAGGTANTPSGVVSFPAGLPLGTFINLLTAGTPGDLVNNFFQLGFNNHPTLNNPTAAPFINLLPNPAGGTIALLTNDAYSRYNSLQLEVRRRFSQGLYFQANYTYSKTLTNAVGGDQFYFEPYLDNARPELDEQRADFDQTHVFNFNGVYQLPFGKGRTFLNQGGIVDKIFGGWELSSIVQWATGAPISILDPRGTFNTGARSARQTAQSNLSVREIRALGGVYEANGNIYWINPSVIGPSGAASAGFGQTPFAGQVFFNNNPGETGNLPRTILNGPQYFNVNAALLKNITFSESIRVQLRAEAFNLFNNVNFFNNTQLANINSPTFGQIISAGDPRILQFGARFEF
jgi:hypothetical protein